MSRPRAYLAGRWFDLDHSRVTVTIYGSLKPNGEAGRADDVRHAGDPREGMGATPSPGNRRAGTSGGLPGAVAQRG